MTSFWIAWQADLRQAWALSSLSDNTREGLLSRVAPYAPTRRQVAVDLSAKAATPLHWRLGE